METISLKMEGKLLKDIDNALKEHRYSTRTEFVRDAIRSKLTALEKEDAIRKLAALKGSLKGKAKMSDEEARDLAAQDALRKFGLKSD